MTASTCAPPVTLEDTPDSACDFGNTAHNPDDAPFTCNNKLIGAREMLDTYRLLTGLDPAEFDSARDDDGHGTHTASTAAGNAGVAAAVMGIPRGTDLGHRPACARHGLQGPRHAGRLHLRPGGGD